MLIECIYLNANLYMCLSFSLSMCVSLPLFLLPLVPSAWLLSSLPQVYSEVQKTQQLAATDPADPEEGRGAVRVSDLHPPAEDPAHVLVRERWVCYLCATCACVEKSCVCVWGVVNGVCICVLVCECMILGKRTEKQERVQISVKCESKHEDESGVTVLKFLSIRKLGRWKRRVTG